MSNSIIPVTIDLVQAMNRAVTDMVWVPDLSEYPAVIQSAHCPVAFTELESVSFGALGNDETTIPLIVRVLMEELGQDNFGNVKARIAQMQNDFICHYTDENNYAAVGMKLLQKEPVRIKVVDGRAAFEMTGYQLIEYPEGLERWFHGFELRFSVQTATWSC